VSLAQREEGLWKFRPTILPLQLSRRFVSQRERSHDLMLGFPYQRRTAVEVVVPEGVAIESLPQDMDIALPFGAFQRRSSRTDKGVRLESTFTLKVRRLAAADYAAFKEFCNTVDNADEERIVYREGGPPAAPAPAKPAAPDPAAGADR